jgi:lipopolysaccharide/colanic/teichoic acid biosynthesis glycosyltransferase
MTARRVVDVIVAAVALAMSVPLQMTIAMILLVTQGRPVLFSQARVGQGGRVFRLHKFRTMTQATDHTGAPLPDEDRLTAIGRLLRRLSLDELPELWNVLIGEMSFVGPRPLPVRYLPRYRPSELRRHDVHPGLTGWAQINGRNAVDWDDRLAMDVWYVEHRNLALDIRIILRTPSVVLRGKGVSGKGTQTMQELRPELGAPVATGE